MASNITTEEEFSQLAKLFYEEKHKLNIPEKVEHSIKLITTHKLDEALEILLDLKNNFEKGLQYDNNKQYELFSFSDRKRLFCETEMHTIDSGFQSSFRCIDVT